MNKWTLFTPTMFFFELLGRREVRDKLAAINEQLPLTPAMRVLEVGCGIGTVLAELSHYGCRISGVDPTAAMLWVARRRFPGADLFEEPAHAMRSIPDKSQDISIIRSTLHGFDSQYRQQVYTEIKRVTREAVMVIDYHETNSRLVALTEWIERSDYFRFVKVIENELTTAFPQLQILRFPGYESLYLCWMQKLDRATARS